MRNIWRFHRTFIIEAVLLAACDVAAWFLNRPMFVMLSVCLAVVLAVGFGDYFRRTKKVKTVLRTMGKDLATPKSEALSELKIPVIAADKNGNVVWVNRAFVSGVDRGYGFLGKNMSEFIPEERNEELLTSGTAEIVIGGRRFSVYYTSVEEDKEQTSYCFFIDQTDLKRTADEYRSSRPVIGFIMLDGFDELLKNVKDSEASAFRSMVQQAIETWVGESSGLLRRLSSDRFLFVIEEQNYLHYAEEHFSILKRVRELKAGAIANASVSIGIGRGGKTLAENAALAAQALDMALGRGGDQVVVQSPGNEFRFFGGVAGALEKRTKVRTRIMATALKKLIAGSDNVMVMGHRFSDLDCLGAAFGICSLARRSGKDAYIVLDRENSLAKPLIPSILRKYPDCLINERTALSLMEKKTLLVIVDVHRPFFLESTPVYASAHDVVVIDHHRKAVDYIQNSLIFYHETAVSSTCEMVTELLQYADSSVFDKPLAEALLAGITLDTRHFVLHTGVRTFEAAAYLRSAGADPVAVKRLFSDSADTYKKKARIVSSAEIYGGCAIARYTENDPQVRIVTSQAADELLDVEGVSASFVLFPADGKINISARSLGEWNVQVIMESLGGGGHRTMAACQTDAADMEEAVGRVRGAIDKYRENM